MPKINRQQSRRGATMVEFALVSTLLIGLTMAMIQYGIIFNTTIGLTNLSREGARYAAVKAHLPNSDADIRNHMTSNLPSGVKESDLIIEITPPDTPTRQKGQVVNVTVKYPMSRKLFLPASFLGIRIFNDEYSTTGRMMVEGGV